MTPAPAPPLPLAPCAFRDQDSRGRRHAEPVHPYRGEFQRDRDRLIHARAFRRLENKTQVFGPRYSDHFRNRLTHTLEVAQISRTVARATGLNGDLVETLALAHDIGHPPFGHAGEKALHRLMQGYGAAFDHNLHALRIVEEIESRYIAFPGLNLAFEVREGIVKHSHRYRPEEHPELAEYDLDLNPPAEAQLIDLTDEIAYLCADLDDGFEAGLLELDEIAAGVPQFGQLLERIETAAPRQLRFNEALRQLLDSFVTGLVEHLRAVLPEFDSAAAVRRRAASVVELPAAMETRRRQLKDFLYAALYRHPRLQRENERAQVIVERVFQKYMAHPNSLPASYLQRLERSSLPRVVCDYLAGMTDSYISGLVPRHDL